MVKPLLIGLPPVSLGLYLITFHGVGFGLFIITLSLLAAVLLASWLIGRAVLDTVEHLKK